MRLQITKTYIHTVDLDKERHRINTLFSDEPETCKRLQDILDAFASQDLDKMFDLYDKLPYNDKAECPEQEFMGMWFWNILDSNNCEVTITKKFL